MSNTTTRVTAASNTYSKRLGIEKQLVYAHLVYTSDATAGNRQIKFSIKDASGNILADFHAGAVQAASLVYHYVFQAGVYRETSFINNEIQIAIPAGIVIPAYATFTVEDDNAVSGSDSLALAYQVKDPD